MPTKPEHSPRDRARILCESAGSILSIRVRGEIDHHTASEIRRGIDAVLFEKRPKKFLLDLSAVSFMDSSGLGLIMGRYSVMQELEGEMIVWNPSPEIRSIMTLAGMERMVRIEYPSSEKDSTQTGIAANPPPPHRPSESTPRPRTAPKRRKKSVASVATPRTERKEREA